MGMIMVTGSAGLAGSETVKRFLSHGLEVLGIDNDLRRYFFGAEASTAPNREALLKLPGYTHANTDIRDMDALSALFKKYGTAIQAVVHTAAQPSHDWAAREPLTDFGVNALGTLHLLEAARRHCPEAVFIFTSTNKVYGDLPNALPLEEQATRWELAASHPFFRHGIDESMSIDASTHSLFGASKVAADVMVQEYGRYFGMRTVCFRGGCLTGPAHSGAELHGFLSYLMKCAVTGRPYQVFGHKGKQVRDNLHSHDLVDAFWQFFQAPRHGEVYNLGGGRRAHCSLLEAIALCEEISARPLRWSYQDQARRGDHQWYVSDCSKFKRHYPDWQCRYDLRSTLQEIHDALAAG